MDAEAELNEALNRAYKGQAGIEEIREVNFPIFADDYLTRYSKPSKTSATYEYDKLIVRVHLKPFFGDKPLSEIPACSVEEYKANRRSKVKPSTVNRELDVLKSLFRKAVEWGYLRENPSDRIRKFRTEQTAPRFLSREEGASLIDAARGQMKGFVVAALNTGMRKGELFRLKWSDVDFDRGQIRIEQTKGKRFRYIPMNDSLQSTLQRHPRHIASDYVFHNSDGSQWKDIRATFRAISKKVGIDALTIHGLRHTFVSNLVMAGEDLRTVQELAGHRDINTTMRYAHLAPEHLRASVEKLNWSSQRKSKLAQHR